MVVFKDEGLVSLVVNQVVNDGARQVRGQLYVVDRRTKYSFR